MEYNVLESIWFNKIGIVCVQTEYDGIKYYIGQGQGLDMQQDEQHIATWGQPFYPNVINAFLSK